MGDAAGDRRERGAREPLTLKVEYDDASQLVADYTENISRGGTFVHTSRELEPGTPVRLVLSFPGLLQPLCVAGEVRWVRRADEGEPGVGVEFAGEAADGGARLRALVDRIAAGDPALVARTLRILLVEDNPHVAALIREGLTGGGRRELGGRVAFQFVTAANGREALDLLGGDPRFDALIVDVYLPILDGVHVIRSVRAHPGLRSVPIVAMSAGGAQARESAIGAGADFFLDKPMRLVDIFRTMRRLTGLG